MIRPLLLLSALALLAPAPPARADGPALTNATPMAYVLSPDDQLDISVRGHDDFKASVTVLPDGTFNYPVVGKVHAAGPDRGRPEPHPDARPVRPA